MSDEEFEVASQELMEKFHGFAKKELPDVFKAMLETVDSWKTPMGYFVSWLLESYDLVERKEE
jgi:hypothetical protein